MSKMKGTGWPSCWEADDVMMDKLDREAWADFGGEKSVFETEGVGDGGGVVGEEDAPWMETAGGEHSEQCRNVVSTVGGSDGGSARGMAWDSEKVCAAW